jgi:hypothetical protein
MKICGIGSAPLEAPRQVGIRRDDQDRHRRAVLRARRATVMPSICGIRKSVTSTSGAGPRQALQPREAPPGRPRR